ncbi:Uncharacterized conserved protein, DUF362 family [Caldanaerobius fijiensis DSM 17918]|uniref:Uncharacterized conserved protein, DUF362 family n=1 Tax=Caldanaerobius fijiensis DSM 17918 TaxID=1121256 RepID=A0A1M4VGT0_9THEO|nr:DUF362 domain-containing protein [Caldanaerobius fijiensis]SHE68127.1 Uncharacterized conserved protein, DUF362 family [Caldanaerobius fijiensis DSM 17918]
MDKVSIVKCQDYDQKNVDLAVAQAVELLGGIENYVKKDSRVFLKVNLLKKNSPDDAVTTHPSVVEAVVKLVQKAGATPIIGDSPGGPFSERLLRSIYSATGMSDVAKRTGTLLNYDTGEITEKIPDGKIIKQVTLMKAIRDCDAIISLPKLKTHGMMVYTGAVKNLFGFIPGMVKAGYHLNMPNVKDFSQVLIDLSLHIKPSLSIMDAVVGMEGNGPSAGKPRKVGLIIASPSAFALDTIAISVIGLKPDEVPTVARANGMGLGLKENIEVIGCSVKDVAVEDFDVPGLRGFALMDRIPPFVLKYLNKHVKPRPQFNYNSCKGCGVCVSNCPPGALSMLNKKPVVDLDKCIRCFCCQELCPHRAVEIRQPFISRFMFRR